MDKRRLGRTDLKVTSIGAGCWPIGGACSNLEMGAGWDGVNPTEALNALEYAFKKGVNVFDTADVYGLGESEKMLGHILKKCIKGGIVKRSDIILSSKVGYFAVDGIYGFDPEYMEQQLKQSLKNLQTDYIDIYFFHHQNFGANDDYLEGALETMKKFQRDGVIRFIGLRGPHKFSVDRRKKVESHNEMDKFMRLVDFIDPDVIGVRYNMISPSYDKNPENNIFSWAEETDRGVVTYKPLGQGLLLKKHDPDSPPKFSKDDHRSRKAWFKSKGLEELNSRLKVIGEHFQCKQTADFVRLALSYCLGRSNHHCTLVGFKTQQQLSDAIQTKITPLTPEEMDYIREIFEDIHSRIGKFIKFAA
ncbi:MAG: aldo/keto reductase [Candidatus Lokiarchaeota archaeon]|nr:aldo/keto reductase [Candidatus Lokiarchaeota archaeon]